MGSAEQTISDQADTGKSQDASALCGLQIQVSSLAVFAFLEMNNKSKSGILLGGTPAEANINDLHYLHPYQGEDNGQVKSPK